MGGFRWTNGFGLILPPLIRIFITLTYLNNIYYYYFINKYLFINIFFFHPQVPIVSLSLSIVLCLYFSLNSLPHSNLKPRSAAVSSNLAAANRQPPGGDKSAATWRQQIGGKSMANPMGFSVGFHVVFHWIFHMAFSLGWI